MCLDFARACCVCVCAAADVHGLISPDVTLVAYLNVCVCAVADVEAFISLDKYTVACSHG